MSRILVADPAAEVRELLERMVARLGHEPIAVTAATVAGGEYDAALIEPALGVDFLAHLRAAHPGLPLVFASIHPRSAETEALGPVEHLVKPVTLADLDRALTAAFAVAPVPAEA